MGQVEHFAIEMRILRAGTAVVDFWKRPAARSGAIVALAVSYD
jgi:hypothetical protein